jgi:activating signal cointegrator 1
VRLISLWEPWATLMAIGAKRIETRSWSTRYSGWLAIHASKGGLSKRLLADCLDEPAFKRALFGEQLSPGCIVAVVNLVECCPTVDMIQSSAFPSAFRKYPELDTAQEREFGDFSEGRWGWVTDQLFRLPQPIPFRAAQGLCGVGDDVIAQIREQWRSSQQGPAHAPDGAGASDDSGGGSQ